MSKRQGCLKNQKKNVLWVKDAPNTTLNEIMDSQHSSNQSEELFQDYKDWNNNCILQQDSLMKQNRPESQPKSNVGSRISSQQRESPPVNNLFMDKGREFESESKSKQRGQENKQSERILRTEGNDYDDQDRIIDRDSKLRNQFDKRESQLSGINGKTSKIWEISNGNHLTQIHAKKHQKKVLTEQRIINNCPFGFIQEDSLYGSRAGLFSSNVQVKKLQESIINKSNGKNVHDHTMDIAQQHIEMTNILQKKFIERSMKKNKKVHHEQNNGEQILNKLNEHILFTKERFDQESLQKTAQMQSNYISNRQNDQDEFVSQRNQSKIVQCQPKGIELEKESIKYKNNKSGIVSIPKQQQSIGLTKAENDFSQGTNNMNCLPFLKQKSTRSCTEKSIENQRILNIRQSIQKKLQLIIGNHEKVSKEMDYAYSDLNDTSFIQENTAQNTEDSSTTSECYTQLPTTYSQHKSSASYNQKDFKLSVNLLSTQNNRRTSSTQALIKNAVVNTSFIILFTFFLLLKYFPIQFYEFFKFQYFKKNLKQQNNYLEI